MLNSKFRVNKIFSETPLLSLIYWFIFGLFLLAIAYKQYKLLSYFEWGDESETIVACKLMASGMKLYAQIFNLHGPFVFLPCYILENFTTISLAGYRIIVALLVDLAFVCILLSPIPSEKKYRSFVFCIAIYIFVNYFPDLYSQTYTYQVFCSLIIIGVLSQYTIPVILNQSNVARKKIFASSFFIAVLPFLAITYTPFSLLVALASFKKTNWKPVVFGTALSFLLNILFLFFTGSLKDYFYLHYTLNAQIQPLYANELTIAYLFRTVYVSFGIDPFHFLWSLVLLIGLSALASKEEAFPYRAILLAFGLLTLIIRGTGYHALPYYSAVFPFFLLLNSKNLLEPKGFIFIGLFFVYAISKLMLLLPDDRSGFDSKTIPLETKFSKLVKTFTSDNDRILVYSFRNYEYLAANRLPASGHHFYLPWQEYLLNSTIPYNGSTPCDDLKISKPKFIFLDKFDRWSVKNDTKWGSPSYGFCVQNYVDTHYRPVPDIPNAYVRSDLNSLGLFSDFPPTRLEPSPSLSPSHPLSLKLSNIDLHGLTSFGLMFGTSSRVNSGSASLQVSYDDGNVISYNLSFPLLKDFEYMYFDVLPSKISDIKIITQDGGGVTSWGVIDSRNQFYNCVVYKYRNGDIFYTPGCPIK